MQGGGGNGCRGDGGYGTVLSTGGPDSSPGSGPGNGRCTGHLASGGTESGLGCMYWGLAGAGVVCITLYIASCHL
jgi:hypothetical protein